jgi:hypothetical protein
MHRTLKQDTLRPPARNAQRQQAAFQDWRKTYNEDRPHAALDYHTPASCYQRSTREFPRRVPELEYDADTLVRRISNNGHLKWKGSALFSARSSPISHWACAPSTNATTKFSTDLWRSDGWTRTDTYFIASGPKHCRKLPKPGPWK